MATMLPIAAIHSGSVAGRLSARMRPVTTALRSPRVFGRFITRRETHSASTAVPMQTAVSTSARLPNQTTAIARAGSSEMITSPITPVVVSGL